MWTVRWGTYGMVCTTTRKDAIALMDALSAPGVRNVDYNWVDGKKILFQQDDPCEITLQEIESIVSREEYERLSKAAAERKAAADAEKAATPEGS